LILIGLPGEVEQMQQATDDDVERVISAVFYTTARRILERIIEVTGLDEKRADALRKVYLRPNDFEVILEGIEDN
jgi:hypothetical protein